MDTREIRTRQLKLANDLLGNCGVAKELIDKYPGRESFKAFLDDYKVYLWAALQMFDEVLSESDGDN